MNCLETEGFPDASDSKSSLANIASAERNLACSAHILPTESGERHAEHRDQAPESSHRIVMERYARPDLKSLLYQIHHI